MVAEIEEIAGLKVRVRRGEEARQDLLYVHGLGESGLCFEKLIERTELEGWNHWVPDLPGYGLSPRPHQPLTLEEQAVQLERWMRRAGISPVVLIGHSMGGVLGQIFCEHFSRQVRGFVNVEGNITLQDCTYSNHVAGDEVNLSPAQERARREHFIEQGFEEILQDVAGKKDPAFEGYLLSLQLCDPAAFYLNSRELVTFSRQEGFAARLRRLQRRIPVLYIAGTPGGASVRSQQLLRNNRVPIEKVSPSGHWPFLDRPEEFCDILTGFLASLSD